jgi:hypothetical protein
VSLLINEVNSSRVCLFVQCSIFITGLVGLVRMHVKLVQSICFLVVIIFHISFVFSGSCC